MSMSPAELRSARFAHVRKGYDSDAVDRALADVADTIEGLQDEHRELGERVRALEAELERYREVESTLSQTLTLAERAAEELKSEAQTDAKRIIAEAQHQMQLAQQALVEAQATTPGHAAPTSAMPDPAFIELLGETRAIRSLLQALLTQGGGAQSAPFAPRT